MRPALAHDLPQVLTHLSSFGSFALADNPTSIFEEWAASKKIIGTYGVDGEMKPADFDDAQAFQSHVVDQLQRPLSLAVIARAPELDANKLNGQRPIIDNVPLFAEAGLITTHAGDLLMEFASLTFPEIRKQRVITGLADVLKAAVRFTSGENGNQRGTIGVLARSFAHHGFTSNMLRTMSPEQAAGFFLHVPQVTMEIENRLLRIVANVDSSDQLEYTYGLTEDLIRAAHKAGAIPSVRTIDGALRILYERDITTNRNLTLKAFNRGGTILFGTLSAVSLLLLLHNIGFVGMREAKVMLGTSGVSAGLAAYNGLRWYLRGLL